MDSTKQYQNLNLSEISFITDEVLRLLREYNILTLDQFLSATRGLTNLALFAGLEDKDELINQFILLVPDNILEMHKNYSEEHPTGLLKITENENNTENNL